MAKSKYRGKKSDIDAYRKERRRVLNYISRQRKKGYDVSDVSVPSVPKKITAGSVRKLQKLDLDYLRSNITYTNVFTGEFTSIKNRVKLDRLKKEYEEDYEKQREENMLHELRSGYFTDEEKSRYYKKYFSRSYIPDGLSKDVKDVNKQKVIEGFMKEVAEYNNKYAYEYISEWLDGWISSFGLEYVGQVLEEAAREGIRLEVTSTDSYPTARRESMKYVKKIMALSGEYDEDILDEILDDMELLS